jgi:hypothetical protein
MSLTRTKAWSETRARYIYSDGGQQTSNIVCVVQNRGWGTDYHTRGHEPLLLHPHIRQFAMHRPRFHPPPLNATPHRHCIRQGRIGIGRGEAVIAIKCHRQPCSVLLTRGHRRAMWQRGEGAPTHRSCSIRLCGQRPRVLHHVKRVNIDPREYIHTSCSHPRVAYDNWMFRGSRAQADAYGGRRLATPHGRRN